MYNSLRYDPYEPTMEGKRAKKSIKQNGIWYYLNLTLLCCYQRKSKMVKVMKRKQRCGRSPVIQDGVPHTGREAAPQLLWH